MDLLTVVRTGLEMGLLLAISWPLATVLRELASRGAGGSVRTWLVVARALVAMSLLLPIGGRLLLRDRAAGWAPVQVWAAHAGDGEGAARITVDAALRSPSPSPQPASRPLGMWIALIAVIAAGGAAFRVVRLVSALIRLRRHLESLPVLRRIGLVRVVASHDASMAYSARVGGRAWVVIPTASLASVSCRRLTIVHEIQHHRHRDTSRAVAFQVLAALFWWNPVLGRLGRALSALEELACDEALVARRSIDRVRYAACLVEAAGRVSQSESFPAHVATMAARSRGLLQRRIEMICSENGRHARGFAIAAAIAVFGTLVTGALVARGAVADRRISRAEAETLAESKEGSIQVKIDDQLLAELNRLAGSPEGRAFVSGALSRMAEHRPAIEKALAEKGLPLELLAVPLVESGFQNMDSKSKLPSMAPGQRGAGIWMFIPETARHYGLRVDGANDDRLDPALETHAAVTMLSELHDRYGDWPLALAAYNQGHRAVDAAIAAGGSRDAAALVREGRLNGYTSTVLAAVLVLRNPKLVE